MTFLGLRSSMQGHETLFLAKPLGMSFKFFCGTKDIHRPADIYGGNGASWEAVPFIEKPLVRGREEDDIKAIHELFFFCPKLLLSTVNVDFFQLISILPQDRHS